MNGRSSGNTRSDLPVRAASGVVAIIVAVGCLWAGGIAWWLLVTAAALAMIDEWGRLVRTGTGGRWLALVLVLAVMALAGLQAPERWWTLDPVRGLLSLFVLALTLSAVLALATRRPLASFGLSYVLLPSLSLLFLRALWDGNFQFGFGAILTAITLAMVWATDIGAYFAGRAIGGAKLAPRISPNKTWAGLFGGMAAASAIVLGALLIGGFSGGQALVGALIGALMAILAQMGDLFESWLKRRAGVKDSGRLLPGHGGALDRLDGLVPVATAMGVLAMFGGLA